jgi:hypothetical protein
MKKWMACQQLLVPLSQQKIDLRIGKCVVKFFNQDGRQHNITDESRLYDEKFMQLNYLKLTVDGWRLAVGSWQLAVGG